MPKREANGSRSNIGRSGEGELFIVATPIGNLQDLSPRAVQTLRGVDAILCEDTRVTASLLYANGIEKRLERADQHASSHQCDEWVARLVSGEKLALVSDAGTPAVSDPGAELVNRAAQAGVRVTPIPGASALTAFLSVSGFTSGSPLFRGFFPRKQADQEDEWKKVSSLPFGVAVVWFESPERIMASIEFLARVAPDAEAVIGKELTKIHEKFYRGYLKDLTSHIQCAHAAGEIRGEWVIGVQLPAQVSSLESVEDDAWRKSLKSLMNAGVSASRAAREVSHVFGISKNTVYAEAIRLAESDSG